jgi:hypothetical protein
MRYMLLICHDSSFTARTVKGDSAAWLEEMERRGVRKHGDRLRPASEAKTVSKRRLSRQIDFARQVSKSRRASARPAWSACYGTARGRR